MRSLIVAVAVSSVSLAGCSGGGGVHSGLNVTIEATPEQGAFPLAVTLKAKVNGADVDPATATFAWDLGDGTQSVEASPVHTFAAIGEYEVQLALTIEGKNGAASKTIIVSDTGVGTDLAVESLEITPVSINPGAQVTVKVTMRNRGTTAFDHSFINRIYITTAETLDPANETPRGTINMPGIAGGESVDKTANITVPTSFAVNQYNVYIVLDAADAVNELDETNNIGKSVEKLNVTSTSLPIDLTASVPTVSSGTVAAGTNVTVDTTVQNLGTADAGQFHLKVFLSADPTVTTSDKEVHTATIPSLAGSATLPQSLMVAIPATIDNRPWYLGVVVDTDSEVAETDEMNNAANLASLLVTTGGSGCTEDANEPNDTQMLATVVMPGSMPALQVCGQTEDWFKIDLGPGDRIDSVINFQNVNGNLDLAVYQMGSANPLATSATSANTERVTSPIALAANTYLVRVTLAGAAAGNTYELVSTLEDNGAPGIDLMPTAIAAGTGVPIPPGTAVATDVTIYNFGDVDATAFDVEIYLSPNAVLEAGDVLLDTFNVTGINAGMMNMASRSVTIPMATVQGYYYLIAKVDAAAAQTEGHELNNEFSFKIGVGNGCIDDLYEPNDTIATSSVIDNGTFADLQICVGGEPQGDVYAVSTGAGGTLMASITNLNADIDLKIVTAANGTPSGCSTCSGTNGGTTSENVSYMSASGGTFYVKVFGYASNKGPYTLTISGSTGSMPDFAPNTVTVSSTSIVAGDDLQVDGKIKNNSTQATPAFEWQIRLSTDSMIGAGDMVLYTKSETALNPAENRTVGQKVTVPESVAGGQYWVGIYADTGSPGTTESSETNNGAAAASSVMIGALCNDDLAEENDTFSQATVQAVGGAPFAGVVCSTDMDYFSFTPATSGTLALHAAFVHSATGDIDMKLYGPTNAQVASSSSVNDDEDISYAVTAGQTYKLKIYGFSGGTQFQTNSYVLTSTLTP